MSCRNSPILSSTLQRNFSLSKRISTFVLTLAVSTYLVYFPVQGYSQTLEGLPKPGVMVPLSPAFTPAVMKGLKIYPENPLRFDFIIDTGRSGLTGEPLREESNRLIRYFLAALTVPEEDLWVNLSPYEKDRIIPGDFGATEMGRDLLAQDYILKQITASLMYPEGGLGKQFWERVYARAYELLGTTEIPVNTFNKVWIVPQKAVVYAHEDTAFVVESKLKVMLEEDYLAGQMNVISDSDDLEPVNEVMRQVILPELEREVNTGKNFAPLRQIYHSIIIDIYA